MFQELIPNKSEFEQKFSHIMKAVTELSGVSLISEIEDELKWDCRPDRLEIEFD